MINLRTRYPAKILMLGGVASALLLIALPVKLGICPSGQRALS